MSTPSKGLEDVIVTSSRLTLIDGVSGSLRYGGYDIAELTDKATFEEVIYLLLHGDLPNRRELNDLNERLSIDRAIPSQIISLIGGFPKDALIMDILRTSVSALSSYDSNLGDNSHDAIIRKSIRLLAKMTTIVASAERLRNGLEPIPPSKELDHASNFLYMLKGEVPDESSRKAFGGCLVLHADHELNASTFASRVTASTLSDVYSAVTSAIGTLKGPLHGGANEAVMEMLETIGSPERVEPFIKKALGEKKRIMGFGHRVYKTIDPRAVILRKLSKELAENQGTELYKISAAIEETMRLEKNLNPNVDFYAASVYHMLGIPTHLFTPIFACSRVAGWSAHILEQYQNNRLIRPRADYVGHQSRKYISPE